VSTDAYAKRVAELTESEKNIHCVGSISLENINDMPLYSHAEFKEKWGIDLSKKSILVTFHPETASASSTIEQADQLVAALGKLSAYQVIITMPNADTSGSIIRKKFTNVFAGSNHVFLIENFGTQSYFTALKHVSFLLGNTSSGIIEAASFKKYVINLGDRQEGRTCGTNVLHIPVDTNQILAAVAAVEKKGEWEGINMYDQGGATDKIISILKVL
jgi:GDP/UDP-N,N'-diacetylbacillosamine 2-epimerase (hydrolysing)